MSAALDLEYLRSQLRYEPETGNFYWIERRRARRVDEPAGSANWCGYIIICIDNSRYRAHRLAWFITHGKWPVGEIDHANGVKGDNRLVNLREAGHSQNAANRSKQSNNRSGYKGVVYVEKCGTYMARLNTGGRYYYLGRHRTAEGAARAYDAKALEMFGQFAQVNFP